MSELAEADASGAVADVYAALRAATGAPVVALIFRHLATHDGLLEEVWRAIGPVMASGRLQETAWRLAAESVPPSLVPPISREAQRVLGLGDGSAPAVIAAIDAYNRANPVNLLVMLCLLRRCQLSAGPISGPAPLAAAPWTPPAPIATELSPMVAPAAMTPDVRRLVGEIGFEKRGAGDVVVPSLLRHLAAVPGLLAALHVVVMPRLRDGSLRRTTDGLHKGMKAAAADLAPMIGPLPGLASRPDVVATIETFTTGWIPLMTIVGLALRRALDETGAR